MFKNDKKKENFVSKNCFLPKCVYGHKESSFENFPGKHSTTGSFFLLNVRKIQKKRFNLKNASKSFYGHVASILTSPMRKLQKRLEFFHSKYTQETSPDETLLLRGFLWTLRLQFRQICQETFARMLKLLLDVQKKWKKKRTFLVFFLIMCLCPQKMKFWISCKTVFVKIPKKILLRDEIDRKIRTLNSRFFSKILGVTEKSSSLNSVENLLPEDDNFFAQFPKMIKKENFVSKNCFLPKCVYGHKESSFENFPGKHSTTGRVFFCSMSGKYKKKDLI